MLEQYIRNYFLDLGLKNQYVDELSPQDDGSYMLLFDTRIVCSIEEQHKDEITEFVFSVVLTAGEMDRSELLEKYDYFSSRLNLTAFSGRACLFILPEEHQIALMHRINCDGLEHQEFNRILNLLARTIIFVEGSGETALSYDDSTIKESSEKFHSLLGAMNISVEDLRHNFNRLDLKDGFGCLLEFHPAAAVLKLINVLESPLNEENILNLLSFNSSQKFGLQFNYLDGSLFIEQSVDLKNTDPEHFGLVLERQRKLIEEFNKGFSAVPEHVEQVNYDITEMLSNLPV